MAGFCLPWLVAKILVVDDEQDIRDVLRAALESNGYEVIESADAEGALSILEAGQVDLMLLDVFLPKMNGIELLERIRLQSAEVPVIVMSGRSPKALNLLGIVDHSPAIRVLPKPFSPQQLLETVGEALRT